jgi:hypothetical protein
MAQRIMGIQYLDEPALPLELPGVTPVWYGFAMTTEQHHVEARNCPNCGQKMRFSSVAIYDDDHDLRTFECGPCQHSEHVTVNLRMSSAKSG